MAKNKVVSISDGPKLIDVARTFVNTNQYINGHQYNGDTIANLESTVDQVMRRFGYYVRGNDICRDEN